MAACLCLACLALSPGCAREAAGVRPAVPYADADSMALKIDCQPEGAEVRIDGVFQGNCELLGRENSVLRLSAGTHELEVVAEGHREYRAMVSARGMRQTVTVRLQPLPAD